MHRYQAVVLDEQYRVVWRTIRSCVKLPKLIVEIYGSGEGQYMKCRQIHQVFSLVILSAISVTTGFAQCTGTSTNSTCTSTTAASVNDTNAASQPPATYSPYPDTVTVSGMS